MPISMPILALWASVAFTSGLSIYGTVATLGVFRSLGWVDRLPDGLEVLSHPLAIGVAVLLFVCEWLVDRARPYVAVWDAIHLFIRPPAAVLLSFAVLHELPLPVRSLAAIAGGVLAFATHSTKSSVRFAANASRESYPNAILSVSERATLLALLYLALFHPIWALGVVVVGCVAMAFILPRVLLAFLRAVNRTLDAMLARTRQKEGNSP